MASIQTLSPILSSHRNLPSTLRHSRRTMARRSANQRRPALGLMHVARSLHAVGSLARKPALGELQCSCCMICATPPAPPPTHHHHSLLHPSVHIHSHCKPPCSRYYHFSRRHILFCASDQSLSKTSTPPIARPPSRHSLCSPCHQTPSSLQTALLRFPSAYNH